ncbi:beta-N-acetylhexosaminidase [Leifsonia poae]|uniref:beta-N-acetylhexosaminidase n=1 Tax=Leifsonia poae TaxID=110933 RepID=A0A9W6LYK4_9MICO|nr:beta-N-acetylhexosaminidase [Leifsonia poae]GLJ74926.1 beta-N-acetylhexosaminidase [Leifsonia poae]
MPAGEPIPVIPRPVSAESVDGAPFTLRPGARVSVAGAGAGEVAELLLAELASDCRRDLTVVHEPPAFGDIAIVIAEDEVPEDARAEGYNLAVTAEGVRIGAASAAGAFWGVQTLRQLLPVECASDPLTIEPVIIRDRPRYAYRGAMLDVARHFFAPAEVRRFIDAIVLLKINHLHLHLTDDQGWRIQIERWPNLTAHGGSTGSDGSAGGFYTQDEFRELVAYAAARHVTIVPELDMPGHTNAALASYPELTPSGVAPALYTGSKVGFSTLQADDVRTWEFIDDVVGEVAALTPGPYLHIGGDECLSTSPGEFLRFIARATAIVADHGKTPAGWHEMGKSDALPDGTIGQYWDFLTPRESAGDETLSFVRQGGSVIMSPADVSYLDIVYEEGDRLGQDWADGPTSIRQSYEWDPARIVPGLGDAHILGVEGPVWTETLATIDDVEEMVFPRLAAVAEVAWSPAPADTADVESVRDFGDFAPRLAALGAHWAAAGTNFRRVPEIAWHEHASV